MLGSNNQKDLIHCQSSRFSTEENIRFESLREQIDKVNSEDDDTTLLNDDTDDGDFSLDVGNKEKY